MATPVPKRVSVELIQRIACRSYQQRTRLPWSARTLPRARSIHGTASRPTRDRTEQQLRTTDRKSRSKHRASGTAPLGFMAAGGLLLSAFMVSFPTAKEDDGFSDCSADTPTPASNDDRDPTLPRFRLSDVKKHDSSSPNPWVVFEDRVYDITDWIPAHPGGDVILRAAGASIDPYWKIFTIHNQPHVREIMSQYLIGLVDAADLIDGRPAAEDIEDPFEQDPLRDTRLVKHTAKPCNAESPNTDLDRKFHTANDVFYVRNHMWVPVVKEEEADDHALTVELPDGEIKRYSLGELKARFKVHKVTAVLQCSGNRRSDMTRHAAKTNGLQWGVGAIGNAEWEGVRLADVLADAGLKVTSMASLTRADDAARDPPAENSDELTNPNTHHVQFSGLEAYGSSIPLAKAIDPRGDVLLAFRMNGQPLPRDHGYPLRALVPGHVAARSVKWLTKIVISDEESPSQWQRRDYKSFGPNEGAHPDWDKAPAIQEMPITSAITSIWIGECVRRGRVPWISRGKDRAAASRVDEQQGSLNLADAGARVGFTATVPCPKELRQEPIALQGYAYSGGGREISRVDISLDGGKNWDQAELVHGQADGDGDWKGNSNWSWKRWRYTGQLPNLPLPKDAQTSSNDGAHCTTVIVKATDVSYNTQPECHGSIYNVRGNLANAWHQVRVCPKCTRTGNGVVWSTGQAYGCGFKKEPESTA